MRNGTVAEMVRDDREQLDDFAQFMCGRDRRFFHIDCIIHKDQSEDIWRKCWEVFDSWQGWLEDFCRTTDS